MNRGKERMDGVNWPLPIDLILMFQALDNRLYGGTHTLFYSMYVTNTGILELE